MVRQLSATRLALIPSWRFFTRHPWQLGLTLLSIALGTAVMIAVDLANNTASRSFDRSVQVLSGPMTHEIRAAQGDVPEDIYSTLRREWGIRASTPLVEGAVIIEGLEYDLLGVDPLAYFSEDLTSQLPSASALGFDKAVISRLLTEPNSVVLPAPLARAHDIKVDDALEVGIPGLAPSQTSVIFKVIAVQNPDDIQADTRLDNVVLTDIATAQTVLKKTGFLSRIPLRLNEAEAQRLQARLPSGLLLDSYAKQQQTFSRMSQAFRVNLTAMSLLAMLVGAFLVYNTMTFSVLQRRRSFAIQRMLGTTGTQLFRQLVAEALLLGLVGGLIGVLLGIVLGQGLLILVTQTISDLYVSVNAHQLQLDAVRLLRSLGITLLAVLVATLFPALEAARVQPVLVARASQLEAQGVSASRGLLSAGVLGMLLTPVLILLSGSSLVWGFAGLFLFVLGYSLCIPSALFSLLMRLRDISLKGGWLTQMAIRGIESSLSRTSLAIIALTVAVSATVGVSIMIGSFRTSVADWLHSTLRSDVYISSASRGASRSSGDLDPVWLTRVNSLSEVSAVSTGRNVRAEVNGSLVPMLVLQPGGHSARGFQFLSGDAKAIWQRFLNDEVILVSEPFAYHHGVQSGDQVTVLSAAAGMITLEVAGIYQDYSASQGMTVLPRQVYDRYWQDPAISTIGISLFDRNQQTGMMQQLRQWAALDGGGVLIRSNQDIQDYSLQVFDRTFIVTQVLRVLVILVAFIGVFSALMALLLEKRREFAVLRATGMTPAQLRNLVLLQSALIGLLAGLLSLPLGWIMSDILIEVINRRSFGWTMQSYFFWYIPAQAVMLAVLAALLAAVYPTRRISMVTIREGLASP